MPIQYIILGNRKLMFLYVFFVVVVLIVTALLFIILFYFRNATLVFHFVLPIK